MDRRESVQLESEDYEWRRLPTWMANATVYLGKTTVQMLYIIDFEHDRGAAPGSPWASPLGVPSKNITVGTSRLMQTLFEIINMVFELIDLPARLPTASHICTHGIRIL